MEGYRRRRQRDRSEIYHSLIKLIEMNEFKNLIISAIFSSPAVYIAVSSPSALTIISSIILPIVFFVVSKIVDVYIQIYVKRKK